MAGNLYWRGKGVKQSSKTAFALWQSADFHSKHVKPRGLRGLFFRTAR